MKPTYKTIPSKTKTLYRLYNRANPADTAGWNRLIEVIEAAERAEDLTAALETIIAELWANIPFEEEHKFFSSPEIKQILES